MSRYYSYLNSAITILLGYRGEEPLSAHLKKVFAQNKKYGSADRKKITHLCYGYYRLGHAQKDLPVEERLLLALFLCSNQPDPMLAMVKPGWDEQITKTLPEKLTLLNLSFRAEDIFPWTASLSKGIDPGSFAFSHLTQPGLFLRSRPGHDQQVKQKLRNQGILFNELPGYGLVLPNSSKMEGLIELDKEAVVQDYSSQRVGEIFNNYKPQTTNYKLALWDCCAGSGGKSILAVDIFGGIDLTVSDIRKTILVNLESRFEKAGIKDYRSLVADLTQPVKGITKNQFDLVIADMPCTGSGTWGRTPEQLYFFREEKIEMFAALQQTIIVNVIAHLKPGGYLLYITCSVFKQENEEAVEKIVKKHAMELIEMTLYKGYEMKADTMFGALLKKH